MPGLQQDTLQALGKQLAQYHFYDGAKTLFYDDAEHSYTRFDGLDYIEVPSVTTAVHIIDKSGALTQWAANEAVKYVQAAWDQADQERLHVEGLNEWFKQTLEQARFAHRAIKETSADIGSMAHDCLEDTIKHAIANTNGVVHEVINLPENEQSANCVMAGMTWMQRHNVRWVYTERKIYSATHDYAGTLDGLAFVSSCDNPECCPEPFFNVLSVIDWKSSNGLYDEYRLQTAAYQFALIEELGLAVEQRWILRLGKKDGKFEPWHIFGSDYELDFQTFLDALHLFKNVDAIKNRERVIKAELKAIAKAKKEAAKEAAKLEKAAAKADAKLAKAAEKEAAKAAKKAGNAKESVLLQVPQQSASDGVGVERVS